MEVNGKLVGCGGVCWEFGVGEEGNLIRIRILGGRLRWLGMLGMSGRWLKFCRRRKIGLGILWGRKGS